MISLSFAAAVTHRLRACVGPPRRRRRRRYTTRRVTLRGSALLLLSAALAGCAAAPEEYHTRHGQVAFALSPATDGSGPPKVPPQPLQRLPPVLPETWEGHRVLRVFLEEEGQLQRFLGLVEKDLSIDVWSRLQLGPVDLRLSPLSFNQSVLPFLSETDVKTETLIENLRPFVDEERNALSLAAVLDWEDVAAALQPEYVEPSSVRSYGQTVGVGEVEGRNSIYNTAGRRRRRKRKKKENGRSRPNSNPFFDSYRDYPTIIKYLDSLVAKHPTLVTAISIGNTIEGTSIAAVQISSTRYTLQEATGMWGPRWGDGADYNDGADEEETGEAGTIETEDAFRNSHVQRGSYRRFNETSFGKKRAFIGRDGKKPDALPGKRQIVISGGQHGREWIAPAVALYIATELIVNYGQEKWATRLVDEFDWTVIPVTNPDGYQYTHTSDRMWRKNREPTPDPFCVGVDISRNWDFEWSNDRASQNPCSDDYGGPRAFSSREAQAVADYITRLSNVAAFVDFHSYSMSWMSPFGGDCSVLPSDNEDILECAQGAVKALYKVHKRQFRTGSFCRVTYKASGLAVDWAYAVGGVKYSYSVELRDAGKHGFLLPPDQIVPSGEESYAAIIAMGRFILNREKGLE